MAVGQSGCAQALGQLGQSLGKVLQVQRSVLGLFNLGLVGAGTGRNFSQVTGNVFTDGCLFLRCCRNLDVLGAHRVDRDRDGVQNRASFLHLRDAALTDALTVLNGLGRIGSAGLNVGNDLVDLVGRVGCATRRPHQPGRLRWPR